MTFTRPTITDLIAATSADIDGRLPGADSRLRRSVLNVLARTHAGSLDSLYGALVFLSKQLMPDTAEAEYLDRWSTIWGVARKAASTAAGVVTVAGVVGAIVPAGAELARIDGARFVTTGRTVLAGPSADIEIVASAAGVDGVTSAGAQLTFTSPVSGVAAIATSADGLVGGADEETDAQLLARLLTRIRTPPNGGAANDWTSWALELAGVTRAWSYPGWMGPGTVGVTFVLDGRNDILPTEADLAAMSAHLEPLRPVTATAIVFAPTPLYVDHLIGATPADGAVRDAIIAELDDLYFREATPGGTVYLSRINEAISLAAGEYDHRLYSPAADIVAPAGSIHMRGQVNFQ